MEETHTQGGSAVVTCSALKEIYREKLLQHEPWVKFVHVHGDPKVIRERMQARKDHFMPTTLLDSQLSILELPRNAVTVDVANDPAEQVRIARKALGV
jgi:gluconokinase